MKTFRHVIVLGLLSIVGIMGEVEAEALDSQFEQAAPAEDEICDFVSEMDDLTTSTLIGQTADQLTEALLPEYSDIYTSSENLTSSSDMMSPDIPNFSMDTIATLDMTLLSVANADTFPGIFITETENGFSLSPSDDGILPDIPIPEPGTIVLFITVFGIFGYKRWRRGRPGCAQLSGALVNIFVWDMLTMSLVHAYTTCISAFQQFKRITTCQFPPIPLPGIPSLAFEHSKHLRTLRGFFRLIALSRHIRTALQRRYSPENAPILIEQITELIDVCQDVLPSDGYASERGDHGLSSQKEMLFLLPELLRIFRQTLRQLQQTPLHVQAYALKFLSSSFFELQGLYDRITDNRDTPYSSIHQPFCSTLDGQSRSEIRLSEEIEHDPIIQEYRAIPYHDLMNVSVFHHVRVVVYELLPRFVATTVKACFQGTSNDQQRVDPKTVHSVGELRSLLQEHPLTEIMKLRIALHRHTMRLFDMVCTRMILGWCRPLLECLVLATWIQAVKDHIMPAIHLLNVTSPGEGPGTLNISGTIFMQPRITFRLKRFQILKTRTMPVGDNVRPHELGAWMRHNSLDELLQFFNITYGDMGGLGIRPIPEHEMFETKETQWLYGALMSFVPGGLTSPGSIMMRNTNYGLTKAQQLLQEILFYDPRFQGSSSLITDFKIMFRSLLVLNKGR